VLRYIEVFDSGEVVDFLPEFAEKLPLSIILKFAGAPESDMPLVNRWAAQFFSTLMGQSTREEYLKSVNAVCELYQYVAQRVRAVKEQRDDSLLCTVVYAHEATGDAPLSLEETLSIFHVLLLAGHDTARQTLTNAMRVLATHPDLYARMRADRELAKPLVDEVLRMYSPANITARRTTRETELGGVTIPKDSTVFMCWGSGNRDAAEWADPEEFVCPRKGGGTHLGFGYGIHTCVGMSLAKAELLATIAAFVARYEEIRLAVPEEQLEYSPTINLRSLTSLPIRCRRVA
jgi:cytochrome P450